MIKQICIFIIFLTFLSTSLFSQSINCGAIEENGIPLEVTSTDAARVVSKSYLIKVHFHVVRNSNGMNVFKLPNFDDVITNLNKYFIIHGIIFTKNGVSYIDDNASLHIESYSEGSLLKNNNNLNGVINYYITDKLINGTVGGYSISFGTNYLFVTDGNTMNYVSIHEMGHALGLLHTFRGLKEEGTNKVIYGCPEDIDQNSSNWENCIECGDHVCDTPADKGNGESNGYNPDITNFMSYYYNLDHFTVGQGQLMRENLEYHPRYKNMIDNNSLSFTTENLDYPCYEPITNISIKELSGISTPIKWTIESNSSTYFIQTNNNTLPITPDMFMLQDGESKVIRISANMNDITGQTSIIIKKPTLCDCGYDNTNCNGGNNGPPSPLMVYPNPTSSTLTIEVDDDKTKLINDIIPSNINTTFKLINLRGEIIKEGYINNIKTFNTYSLNPETYLLKVKINNKTFTKRIIIK